MFRLFAVNHWRSLLRGLFGLALVLQTTGVAPPVQAQAASITVTATLTGGLGTVALGGETFAGLGAPLSVGLVTSPATGCVVVSVGTQEMARQTSRTPQAAWLVPFPAPTGDGLQNVTVTAYKQANCTGASGAGAASTLFLDNTAPSVTGALSPAPNAAGWNNSAVTVSWTATDDGSGIANGPQFPSQTLTTGGITTPTASATDRLGHVGMGSVKVQVDKDAPTIIASRSPAPNTNGWNNADVTVSFTCSDALSGIKSCPAPTTVNVPGTSQSVTGTAVDVADNHASASVAGINIDNSPPTISGSAASAANPDAWYNGDVLIHWSASDDLSGIDPATMPADTVVTGEGAGLVATASVKDKAGNRGTGYGPAVNIDRTPPATIATAPPTWNNSDVTVTLVATDALSGVRATHFRLDGGADQLGTNVVISADGVHTLDFWSEDKAGNSEASKSLQVKIDKTPPTITHTQSPPPNANGWNNTDVSVTFVCDSGLSGVATCTPPQTVTTEGRGESVMGTALNGAGNSATDPAMLNIDKTPPSISGAATREPNANGWYRADVTVHFTCSDALSGVSNCLSDVVMSNEGADQVANSSASDSAGNHTSASVGRISIDKTPPTVSGAAATAANGDGWYNDDVTIRWAVQDNLSGIDLTTKPADSVITGEGAGLTSAASVKDKAGNEGDGRSPAVNIDRTPPSVDASVVDDAGSPRSPNAAGWFNSPVRIRFACNDALSGVSTCSGDVVLSGEGANQQATGEAVDHAGNRATHTKGGINIDLTPPTIVAHAHTADGQPFTSGTWTNQDVTVSFTCSDASSGVATCPDPVTLVGDGTDQDATGTAADVAGNHAAASFGHIDIDKMPPSTSSAEVYGTPDGSGWYISPPLLSLSSSDVASGLADTYYQLVPHGGPAPDSGSSAGWQRYAGPASVDTPGDWDVYAYSVDHAGNRESSKQLGRLGGAGIDVNKNADPSAPLTGTIVVKATAYGSVTITKTEDFYEVHYPGDVKPAGCGLAPGETLTGNSGDLGWYALAGSANGVNLDTYTIQLSGSPALNPATTSGSAQGAVLSDGTTTTWNYTTLGEVGLPAECVLAGANAPNSMRNVILVTTNLGTTLARSVSFPPIFQTEGPPPPCTTCPPPPPPIATPEADSLVLFGSGLAGMAGYALARLRLMRRRT